MANPHAIDIPITDLDADDDDLLSVPEDLDPNVLRDDFDIDDDAAFAKRSFAGRVKDAFAKLTQRSYSRVPDSSMMNGIELRGRFADVDSFDLSDDEFIERRQRDTLIKALLQRMKRHCTYIVILVLFITVIILAALLGKRGKSHSEKNTHKKVTLTNGTDLFYPTTILISLDGFHPHYISKELTPTLHEFLSKEYGAPYMIPSFPSSTFPNHWTLATGLYPESHGIIGNKFYDPVLGKQFINVIPEMSLDPVWWGGEAVWSTAELQGVRSAIHMFPGSEVKFDKGNPSEVDPFNKTESLEIKTNRILGWLDRPIADRPELILSYVPTIDTLGHTYGIHGKEIERGLKYVDTYIHNVSKGISDRNLTDIVNLVIVSDHGMSPTSNDRLVYLDDLVNITKIQYIDGWPLFGLRPYPEFTINEVYQELKNTYQPGAGYKVYLRENLPKEWHFGERSKTLRYLDRIAPLWVVPDIGYIITTYDEMERKGHSYKPKGVHGYNNTEVLMRAIFLGTGPYFREKTDNDTPYKVTPFHNVEVYNIICDMLNIIPAANNGTSDLINEKNILPANWKDPYDYPDVKFTVGDILKEDSTYDDLFRPSMNRVTTTLEQGGDEQTQMTQEPTHQDTITNPTDEAAVETGTIDDATYGDQESQDQGRVSNGSEDESKENNGNNVADDSENDSENDGENDGENDIENDIENGNNNDNENENEHEDEQKPDNNAHKGIWDKIGDGWEDLEDALEDIGDNLKGGAEELMDEIEDVYDDFTGKGDNDN